MLKITRDQAQKIIDLKVSGTTTSQLTKMFGVSQGCILCVLNGKTWVECNRPNDLQCLIGKLDQRQAQEMIDLFVAGESIDRLSQQFGVTKGNIYNIIRGLTWKKCNRPEGIEEGLKHPITQALAQQIIEEFCRGASTYELEEKYDLWQSSICNLIAGRTWPQCDRPPNIEEIIEQRRQKGIFALGRKCHIDAPPFTSVQEDVIIGSLLGDGSISHNSLNGGFSKTQKLGRLAYLEWMNEVFGPYGNGIKPIHSSEKLIGGKSGRIIERRKVEKRHSGYILTTHQHPNWTELREQWYKNKIKIVPMNLTLNELRVATWFWDDGNNDSQQRAATFCTQSFTAEEAKFLSSKLHDFDIFPKIVFVTSSYTGKKMPMLKVYSKSYDNLIELVKPHMLWDCFAYKIRHRVALTNATRKPISEWKRSPNVLTAEDVIRILRMKGVKSQQEIADQFDVRQTTISAIMTGKIWKHIHRA